MEDAGPDGNYEELNLTCMVLSYVLYKDLPDASPAVAQSLLDTIDTSMAFQQFYFVPPPTAATYYPRDGKTISPSALSSRTSTSMTLQGYPGDFAAKAFNGSSLSRYAISAQLATTTSGGGLANLRIPLTAGMPLTFTITAS